MSEPFQPATREEAAAFVAEGQPLRVLGGGVGQDHGRPAAPEGVRVLDIGGLNRIVAIEPGDMTVTVEAGVTLAQVQAALAAHGQWLPLDPPVPERATIGGVLATGAFGPMRLGYGTPRDWLLGLTVLSAGGKLLRGGGKVVKNVTGYDLPKLHVGALGTLGVIIEATFKTAPRPEAVRTAIIRATGASLEGFSRELLHKTSPVQALLHEDGDGRVLAIVYHGPSEATDDEARRCADLAESAALPVSVYGEEFPATPPPTPLAVRLFGLPADACALHEAVRAAAGGSATLDTYLGVGCVEARWDDSEDAEARVGALFALAEKQGVRASLLHGPEELRASLPALWTPPPPALPLMRALKKSFDPEGILNPGRFLV